MPLAQSPGASTGPRPADHQVAYISPEQANDYGWNQQGAEGARPQPTPSAPSSSWPMAPATTTRRPSSTSWATTAHSSSSPRPVATAPPALSTRPRRGIPVIVYDRPDLISPGLVGDIATDSQQGGYLAGVLAATMSKTGTLGIVIVRR